MWLPQVGHTGRCAVEWDDELVSATLWFWIIVIAVVVLAVALVTGLTIARKRKISLSERAQTQEDSGRQSTGSYRADTGIALAPGGQRTEQPTPEPPPAFPERPEADGEPAVGEDAAVPRDEPGRAVADVDLPEQTVPAAAPSTEAADLESLTDTGPTTDAEPLTDTGLAAPPAPPTEKAGEPAEKAGEPAEEIAPTTGRLERMRGRLSKSRSALGQGLLGLLGAGDLDEDSWEEVEDTLLVADLGAATTTEIVENLRGELSRRGVRTAEQARAALHDVLTGTLRTDADRAVRALPHTVDGHKQPAVVLVAGVNGTGKTTTTGKLARVLVAQGHRVVLGAADTFRAAAADQLETWSERVGAEVVRGKEGADPAAVAFDSVKRGTADGVDAVLVDTAGRLHTKTGLMDELGKVKRVVEKQAQVDEVLLVLDATTGQNGLTQARVFADVVDVTGIVLTKLDGTAKGGIVFQVQRELGVPVKLVGLGEGPDDLAPFEPTAFVDALLS